MKNWILLVVIGVLSILLINQSTHKKTKDIGSNIEPNSKTIDIKDSATGSIENKELEEYIVGIVAAEMPASFNVEALKAQAIASRTYAYFKMIHSDKEYDVISDVSDQAYITVDQMKEKWGTSFEEYYKKITSAVDNTKNEIMTYNGEVIKAFYFSMSNGYTEDVSPVFGEDYPYLKSVRSKWDNSLLNKYEVTTSFSKQDFCSILDINCDSIIIENQTYDNTGRTDYIVINSKTFKGTEFRKLLDLRSTDFKIDITESNINITTKGYGHGVGMSQYGANGMANEGNDCYAILKHYYHDIQFSKL